MTVDPGAPSTFWYTQEYYSTTSFNGWKTRIASFSFADILDIHAMAIPESVCSGGSARLDAEVRGGTGTNSYLWSSDPAGFTSVEKNPEIFPAIPATFIVQVTSGSQQKTDSIFVPVIPMPSVFAGGDTSICRYIPEIKLSGDAINYTTVRWFSSGDGYFTQPDAIDTWYHPGPADKLSDSLLLKLTAYPAAPCLPVSAVRKVIIDACDGIEDLSGKSLVVMLHPNPVSDKLTIEITALKHEKITITILNPLGETLFTETIEVNGKPITREADVTGFPGGFYILRLVSASAITSKPFLVE
jgi:hypothetical protein